MHTPWHLWLVGLATLLLNAGGAFDYVATQYRIESYLGNFSDAQLAWFQTFPAWVVGTWAVAVWGALAGSLLLLARSKWAGAALGVALICMVLTAIHNFSLADSTMDDVMGGAAVWFSLAVFVIGVLSWIYAREMTKRGVLD